VVVFRIEQLSADGYGETRLGELRFDQLRGPHTVNFQRRRVVFDCYSNRISLLAGVRRLGSFLKRRSQNNG
jgi:hypothetical protein